MKKNNLYLLLGLFGVTLTTILVIIILKKRKKKIKKNTEMESIIVEGEYVVPQGTKNMADALHSFERRKSDGFGGKMSTIIKEKLLEYYKKGINPEVTDLTIDIDSKKYEVKWKATIKPSSDGNAYIGFVTFGSAGSGADSRALNQEKATKERVGGKNYKLVLDFKNPTGIYIRQLFYQYTKEENPAHK